VPPAFVALTVTLKFPFVVGVPDIAPVPVFTVSPEGNPLAPKLVGLLLAVMVYGNATPCLPLAVRELVMTGVAGLIVTVSALVPVPPAFVAVMLPLNGPAVVGVPENAPVALLKLTPGIDTGVPKLVGLLVA